MKKLQLSLAGMASLLFLAVATSTFAGESSAPAREVTVTGEAKCAKCSLHKSDTCQTVLQSEKDGKTTTYYLADNDLAKSFHEDICKGGKQATATGTVVEKAGKNELTVTKIALVK